jgi:hypothetical protein
MFLVHIRSAAAHPVPPSYGVQSVNRFYCERDLDEMRLATKATRLRWEQQGKIPPAIKPGGPNGKRFYGDEHLEAIKALAGVRAAGA